MIIYNKLNSLVVRMILISFVMVMQITGVLQAQNFMSPKNIKNLTTFTAKMEPNPVRIGEEVRVVIEMRIKEGWHVYSVIASENEFAPPPTILNLTSDILTNKGPAYETNPISKYDPVIGMVLAFHENKAKFYQNFKIREGFSPGEYQLKGTIRYQACSNKYCLPPKNVDLIIPFNIESGPVRQSYAYMNRTIDEIPQAEEFLPKADSLESAVSKGIWAFMALAAMMGMFAWLTPCVFPMIPITVSYFSKKAQESHHHQFTLALVFSLGIILTYTIAGFLLTTFMGAAGAVIIATNPWINTAMALLFTLFALSLIGVFELNMPSEWIQLVDKTSRRGGGMLGISLMGISFTFIAFSCTVQFVGTLLVAAVHGEWMWPILGMLVFSTIFAFPFFLLAVFPRFIPAIQSKSGAWMNQMKIILGLAELMIVFKFLSNADLVWGWGVIDRTFVLGVWAVLAFAMAIVALGFFPIQGSKTFYRRASHWIFAFSFLGIAFYFGQGVFGKNLDGWTESYLPPALNQQKSEFGPITNESKGAVDDLHSFPWHKNLGVALAQAKKEQKPVFIDFTGYTCVNCRWMEKNVFIDKSVSSILKDQYILVQLYTDGGDGYQDNQKLQIERFNTIALPFYVVLSPENAVLAKHAGISSVKKFVKFLEKGLFWKINH